MIQKRISYYDFLFSTVSKKYSREVLLFYPLAVSIEEYRKRLLLATIAEKQKERRVSTSSCLTKPSQKLTSPYLTPISFDDTTVVYTHHENEEMAIALIGYARVSRIEQNLELQVNKLQEKGCIRIFTDKMTGATFDRKELTAALAFLR